jgi:hypothetical protein
MFIGEGLRNGSWPARGAVDDRKVKGLGNREITEAVASFRNSALHHELRTIDCQSSSILSLDTTKHVQTGQRPEVYSLKREMVTSHQGNKDKKLKSSIELLR